MNKFEGDQPVYLQIVDLFYKWIISGELKPGDQVAPVRKLAADLGVNPNTIQKSLGLLDAEGITTSEVGRGRYITKDAKKIHAVREQVVHTDISIFIERLRGYGLTDKEIEEHLREGLEV